MPEFPPVFTDDPARGALSGTIADRFEIEHRVGVGGMGEVYRARDTRLKCAVALKRLAPALRHDRLYRRRLMEEAQRSAQMRNEPRVAAVYDFLETPDDIFLVMEFVEGETLRQRLTRPIQLQEFLLVAAQCAEGLAAAGAKGILHGDIKPENIMLTPAGQVKILDFGVAKKILSSVDDETVDRAGTLSGTPAYMAPEILLHEPADSRADIFSLGIVFYEALTGQHPFRERSFSATSDKIRSLTPALAHTFNPDVPRALDKILVRMLAKNPAERYPDAGALLSDLEALQSGMTPVRLQRLLPGQRKRARRRIGVWVGALALLIGLAVILEKPIRRFSAPHQDAAVIHLVVLPLRTASAETQDRAFSDGLTEALALWLGQFGDKTRFDVVPPSEVRAASAETVEQARKQFGANRVLEGTVTQSTEQSRVVYTLVDATTGHTLGGDSVTVSRTDRLAMEDRLVASVAALLGMESKAAQRDSQGTREPAAYDYYLLGRGYLLDYHKQENVDSAIAVFKNALEADPNYARAFAGLGESYWRKYGQTQARSWVALAKAACARAVELNDNLAVAHNCLGTLGNGTGEYETAIQQFQRALTLDDRSVDALLGLASAFESLGKPGDAETAYKKAIDLQPNYWGGYTRLGNFYFASGRYSEAEGQYRRVTELVPEGEFGYNNLGASYLAEGRYPDAIDQFERSLRLQSNATSYSNLATSYFFRHQFDEAVRTYENAVRQKDAVYWQWGNLAEAYAQLPAESAKVRPTYEQALKMVGDVIRVNPRNVEAISYASLYEAMLGNRKQALDWLRKIPADAAIEPELWSIAAKVHHRLGLDEQAVAELEKAVTAGYPKVWIRDDPAFAGLATNLHFQRIVK